MRGPLVMMTPKPPAATGDGLLNFGQTAADTSSGTVYTFSGVDIGAASPGRDVIVVLLWRSGTFVTSVTCNGVAMSEDLGYNSESNAVAFWRLNVPTGTTATIVVTLPASASRCLLASYWSSVALEVASTDTAGSLSGTLTHAVEAGQILAVSGGTGLAVSCEWAGATEDYEFTAELIMSGARAEPQSSIGYAWTGGAGYAVAGSVLYREA